MAENCGVEIPSSLIEKLPEAHYIRVAKCDKRPLDKNWPDHSMKPDDPRLQAHLRAGGNYGVVGPWRLNCPLKLLRLAWRLCNVKDAFTSRFQTGGSWAEQKTLQEFG